MGCSLPARTAWRRPGPSCKGFSAMRCRQDGLQVSGVPTSHASAYTARRAGIPLIELGEDIQLDITIDGADEVAPNLDLVKGRGGALVRERIVAAASKRLVILVGEEK